MPNITQIKDGAGSQYCVLPRVAGNNPQYAGTFCFSEHFYESNDKSYDAILVLGARLRHNSWDPHQDLMNSYCYRGMTNKSRAISRLFLKEIYVSYSIPDMLNLDDIYDYTGRESCVLTVDHGKEYVPDIASEGALAELRTINGYAQKTFEHPALPDPPGVHEISGYRSWMHMILSPLHWSYEDLEMTYPLVFYQRSLNFTDDYSKPNWVFWKITAGIRFMASARSEKYVKHWEFGE